MDMKEADRRALRAMFAPVICTFPGCLKRAREEHEHPNGMIKPYCTEHIRTVRNAEKEGEKDGN